MGFFKRLFGKKEKVEEVKEIEIEEVEKINEQEEVQEEEKEKIDEPKKEVEDKKLEDEESSLEVSEKVEEEKEISEKVEAPREVVEESSETKILEEEVMVEEKVKEDKVEETSKKEKVDGNSQKEEQSEREREREEERIKRQKLLRGEEKKTFFGTLKEKLIKSREGLFGKIKTLFVGRDIIDDEMYEELEEILIQSDIGMDMTLKIVDDLRDEVRERKVKDPNEVYSVLKDVMEKYIVTDESDLDIYKEGLNVLLVVGVNGVGKTTTIGKLASKLVKEGKKVVIGAGDTFRAAAIEQLEEWANRSGAEIIKHTQGTDPGAVVYDTLEAAKNKGADIAIIDTAGRLHNKNNLMKELEKINGIIKKKIGEDSYESILVIDGTTGQNGLNQARVFNDVTKLTGFVVTKLDGTAKGGIIFSISEELKKPIRYIGVGEGIEDLRPFKSKEYIDAIFED